MMTPDSGAFHGVVMKALSQPTKPAGKKMGSTQVPVEGDVERVVRDLRRGIPQSDVADKSDLPNYAEDGKDGIPTHVTAKYGIETNNPDDVRRVVSRFGNIEAKVSGISAFTNPDTNYDVLKLDIDSDGLRRLNALISSKLKVTDTHPGYSPHLTIAYLKRGLSKKYVSGVPWIKATMERLRDMKMQFGHLIFSPAEGKDVVIPLGVYVARPAYPARGE